MIVNTYGNRHRLSITFDAPDGNIYFIDSASASQGLPAWTDFGIIVAGQHINTGFEPRTAAKIVALALLHSKIKPKHLYRVPLWAELGREYQQKLLNLILSKVAS